MPVNWAHVHLLLNHVPVNGVVFGLVILAAALLRKSAGLTKTALITFVLIGLLTIPTYLTGEPAEEVVERIAGVSEDDIEHHEEWALWALIAAQALALTSALGLFLSRKTKSVPASMAMVCLFLAIATLGIFTWTVHLGTRIQHHEIHSDSSAAPESSLNTE
ncbi:MAG: hypothetical protein HY648_05635 [Acidobacteria bacterium]|nr:hypothetical protein [Acidobacteriota bacterium]